jgi:5-aminopentanamidase
MGDMSLKIAVVQQNGNPGKPAENRQKAAGYAMSALQQHADVVLFHEELLVGYTPDLRDLAEPVNGSTTQEFQSLLRASSSLIIYGLTERSNDSCYISAPVVGAHGVLANYRKTHLWWNATGLRHEPTYYKAGDQLVTFEIKDYRCGIMICYDGDFPEMTRAYANLGCTVLFWLNNRHSRGYAEVKDLAYRNSMIMAASCCCGPNEVNEWGGGGSNIRDATGKLLAEIWDQEGVIMADVSPEEALALRAGNPWFRGRRPELYHAGAVRAEVEASAGLGDVRIHP